MKNIAHLLVIILTLPSCFENYITVDLTSNWDHHKIMTLQNSKKKLVIYYANTIKSLPRYKVDTDRLYGKIENYFPPGVSHSTPKARTSIRHQPETLALEQITSETHIFISEKFIDQDTVVVNSTNFLQMRELKIHPEIRLFSEIGTSLGLLILIILAAGFWTLYAYLKSTMRSI